MRWRWILVCASAAVLALGQAALAQSATTDVEALVAEALDRSPMLQALDARVQAAGELVAPAGALPDPMVGLALREMGAPWAPERDTTTWEVEASQALPWPGKRESRRQVARAEIAVRAAENRQARQRLVRDVRAGIARLYALDQELAALDAAAEMLDLLAAIARARYASGQAEQEALVKAQLQTSRLKERRLALVAERDEARIEVNRLVGRESSAPLPSVAALPPVEVAGGDLRELALQHGSAIALARAEVETAHAMLEAARLDAKPDFDIGLGVGTSLAPEPMLSLRVGLSLPFWREQKQDRLVAAAAHDLRATQARIREEERRADADVAILVSRWRRAGEQFTLYREAILPQAELAMAAARASYLAGRGDFSMVIEDFGLWLEARVELSRREADRYSAWVGLQELTTYAPGVAPQGGTQ
jgi:outer membrane protein TolC